MKIRCIVVDDEQIGREGIADYISEVDFLNLVGLCKDAIEASNLLNQFQVDLIFLDINMPKLTGIDFIKTLKNPPMIILCTAFPSYALEGFNLNVLDYLVKPITQSRFMQSVNKAKVQYDMMNRTSTDSEDDFFFIKSEGQFVKIYKTEILFIEAMENYSVIHTTESKYMSLISLTALKQKLNSKAFYQTHRSFLVALSKVSKLEGNQIFINDKEIPVSRSQRKELYDLIIQGKLLKK